MKINEIFGGASLKGIGKELYRNVAGDTNYQADKKFAQGVKSKFAPAPTASATPAPAATPADTSPETDISKTVPPGKQFRFLNPELPGSYIIIRQDGYWQDRIAKHLAGQVKKVNGLYPVQREENIKKYNEYYNQAADSNRVREEPVHAL